MEKTVLDFTAEHARRIKAAGAKYCDCPACAEAEAILEKKEALIQ